MPNIGSALREEITRLARKEVRNEIASTQKTIAAYRRLIADLKRRVHPLEREIAQLRKLYAASRGSTDEGPKALRFRAAGLKAHRDRLGLSAREAGLLLGASALTVYKWEQGKAKPRARHLESIAQFRTLGKREAVRRLGELTST
jgi:DNA-binding XRE family transcriptional regulator